MPRRPPPPPPGLPTREAILAFVRSQKESVGKREIARAFGLHAQDKIALKALLKDMQEAGDLEAGPGRTLHKGGGLPKVTVLRIIEAGDEGPIAVPDRWDHPQPPPRVRVIEGKRRAAHGVGDRILSRIEEQGSGYVAFPMKALAKTEEFVLGILRKEALGYRLVPVDKRARSDLSVSDPGEGKPGDLVLAEPGGRPPRQYARVVEVLGDPFAPRSFSLIAIHAKGIPHRFDEMTLEHAEQVARQPLGEREDLRGLPFLTIDPADARDHDDAVWAAPDPDSEGHFRAIVAIADVSFYVRPATQPRPVGAAAWQQRLFPRSRRADAARNPVGRCLLAGRGAGPGCARLPSRHRARRQGEDASASAAPSSAAPPTSPMRRRRPASTRSRASICRCCATSGLPGGR